MMQVEIGIVRIVQIISANSKNISLVRWIKWVTTPFFILKTLLPISHFDTDLLLIFFFFYQIPWDLGLEGSLEGRLILCYVGIVSLLEKFMTTHYRWTALVAYHLHSFYSLQNYKVF